VSLLELALGISSYCSQSDSGAPDPAAPRTIDAEMDGHDRVLGPGKAFAVGAFLGALNPKNIPLTIAAAASIAATGIANGDQAIALVVFAVVGTLGVAAPLAIYSQWQPCRTDLD
jgi:threonine/homoserine/homoserine lactone efflux protein